MARGLYWIGKNQPLPASPQSPALEIGVSTCTFNFLQFLMPPARYPRQFWSTIDWNQTNEDIAKETGLSVYTIAQYRRSFKPPASSRIPWDLVDWAKSNAKIAAELKTSTSNVRIHRSRYDLNKIPDKPLFPPPRWSRNKKWIDPKKVDWDQTIEKLSKELGIPETEAKRIRRNSLRCDFCHYETTLQKFANAWVSSNLTTRQAASVLGTDKATLKEILYRKQTANADLLKIWTEILRLDKSLRKK